jgi:uncharacterized membrane-anchored protein
MLIASMCGANLGDFFPDLLKTSSTTELLFLAILFGSIVLAEALVKQGSELFYWLSVLVVRAAATAIADISIDRQHLRYVTVSAAFAGILAALVFVADRRSGPKPATGDLPATSGLYWFGMLMAGSLGTGIGDGVPHAFHSVQTGVVISAGMATAALALILGMRTGMNWTSGVSYWVAIVAVRWWGTNVGDAFAFLATLPVSLSVTGTAMALVLLFWRTRATVSEGKMRAF